MSTLKRELIKIGNANPDLRKHIKPVLAKIAAGSQVRADLVGNTLTLRLNIHRGRFTVPALYREVERFINTSNNIRHVLNVSGMEVYDEESYIEKNGDMVVEMTVDNAQEDEIARQLRGYNVRF